MHYCNKTQNPKSYIIIIIIASYIARMYIASYIIIASYSIRNSQEFT